MLAFGERAQVCRQRHTPVSRLVQLLLVILQTGRVQDVLLAGWLVGAEAFAALCGGLPRLHQILPCLTATPGHAARRMKITSCVDGAVPTAACTSPAVRGGEFRALNIWRGL